MVCVLTSVFFAVMWMRSSSYFETVYYVPSHNSTVYRIEAVDSRIHFYRSVVSPVFEAGMIIGGEAKNDDTRHYEIGPSYLGFRWSGSLNDLSVGSHYWLLTFVPLVIAGILTRDRIYRFGISHLLIATTAVAIVFGMGYWVSQPNMEYTIDVL